jgi:hypothetical protein
VFVVLLGYLASLLMVCAAGVLRNIVAFPGLLSVFREEGALPLLVVRALGCL